MAGLFNIDLGTTVKEVAGVFTKSADNVAAEVQSNIAADRDVAVAQNKVNEVQAASADTYTSRARPTIMYICGFGFGYQFILQPFLVFISKLFGAVIEAPQADMTAITTLLVTLCGARTYEKIRGVHRK